MVKKVTRPWGNFTEFVKNKKCTVKVIEVKPRQVLSLQVHHSRDEVWHFFGKALVHIGDEVKKVKSGDTVKIKKGKMHRVMAGWRKVKFLEVSYGKFSEQDELRLYDKYNRK